ncbi:MAG: SAM-dependent methyltransferase [Deltaproteobacteria bacterium HGW-Deltaproteobacteria-14]|jgi:tRNA1(Val) A37 N6-methylase TrmN6|nr:MAG: SAM-dependent methyltransferase [Deltaproteobacteria bacterium HGW-Deltaproteobacteria-14]
MTRPPTHAGIIRPARRPAGWSAPGSSPRGAADDPTLVPGPGEDLCHLLGDWRVFQKVGGHRWSLDDLLTGWLAWRVARDAPPARVLDLGTGVGSVLMMTAWHFPEARLVGVEAQAVSADLARRSLRYNGVAARAAVHDGDLRDFDGAHGFDLVTGTPPYFPPGSAVQSDAVQKGPCRHEHRGGVDDYVAAAARAAAPGATVVLCHAALQRDRLLGAAARAGWDAMIVCDVAGRDGKAALVTVAAFRVPPGGAGLAPQHEEFSVRGRDLQWTERFIQVRREMGMPHGRA